MSTYEEAMKLSSFRAWLEAQEPEVSVGVPNVMDHCPLATYLTETMGEKVYVRPHAITRYKAEAWPEEAADFLYPLPPWAKDFVREIDGMEEDDGQHEISAEEARAILLYCLRRVGMEGA